MIITCETHPNILEAMEVIDLDGGVSITPPVRKVPDRWKEYLLGIEKTLGGLSRVDRASESPTLAPHVKPNIKLDSEFYTFCAGEEGEIQAIANRDNAHRTAYLFLDDFFADWHGTDETNHTPEDVVLLHEIKYLDDIRCESSTGLTEVQLERLRELGFPN